MDIFQHINDVNHSVQEKIVNSETTCDLLFAFSKKLLLWSQCMLPKNFAKFSFLDEVILEYSNLDLEENVIAEISQHLEWLRESVDEYFSLEI